MSPRQWLLSAAIAAGTSHFGAMWATAADAITPTAPAKSTVLSFGTLKAVSAADAKAKLESWLRTAGTFDAGRFHAVWAVEDKPVADRVLETVLAARPDLAELLAHASDPLAPAPLAVPALLKDESLPPFVRGTVAVAYARTLGTNRIYEEALESLKGVRPEDVADPAGYYFYKAVAEHALMQREPAAASIVRLLDDVADAPDRYRVVATLMFFDVQNWPKDEKDLANIEKLMDNSGRRLDLARGGPKTQDIQKKIVFRLDEKIKEMENMAKGAGSGQCNVGSCSKLDGAGPAALFGGSLAYMAVEHLDAFNPDHPRAADSLDGRADLFGLAVTLWELATGARPFGPENLRPDWRETLAALAERRRAGPTPEAVAAFPDGVPGLRDVLLRCLDPDPARRPATAGEMARELELCLRPATRALVRPAPSWWRRQVLRHPYLAVYPPGLAPNIFASLFNIFYNKQIIDTWGEDPARQEYAKGVFQELIQVVNGVFFPIGMTLFAWAMWPVARGLKQLRTGAAVDAEALGRARRWSLRLGGVTARVCVGCWLVAGVVWPVSLREWVGPHPHPAEYLHFVGSLVVCGLIAAAYPYFIITYIAVRWLYPALLGPGGADPEDGPALARVGRELGFYRWLATTVPFAAIALLALRGTGQAQPALAGLTTGQLSVAGLSVAGLIGTALAFVLERWTRADLTALAEVPTKPGSASL